ncbi:hypothetical protein BRCH_01713c [Candidatus Burkholderia brachyanthoides]|nr:hypothetical protein BRCH_01713c [Candidatus Burkholderia brachyanthoides]
MCSAGFLQSAARRAKHAFFSHEGRDEAGGKRAEPASVGAQSRPQAPSSIEYREAHRGFLIRVSSNEGGSFSLSVEDPHGRRPALLSECFADAGCSPNQKFRSVREAIDAIERAKSEIDRFLAGSDD